MLKAAATQSASEKDWNTFNSRVKKGEIKDPFGQYVSDDTNVSGQASSIRPKIDGTKRIRVRQGDSTISYAVPPCEEQGCDSGSGEILYGKFVSMETYP